MMMRLQGAACFALVGFAAAGAAAAEPWTCQFTVECQAAGGCSESGHSLEIIAADHEGQLFISSIVGDSPIRRLTDHNAIPATYAGSGGNGLAEMLTIEADGTALMTVHMFETTARAATYFGTCEELQ